MHEADERPADRAPAEARKRNIREATLLSLVVLGVVYAIERSAPAAVLVAILAWLAVHFAVSRLRI